ncbi:unnamed protein product [Rhizophagus irregularis]|uniref:FAR1 domain-containing protein n=1 Tax=Rhizophagus irregularis TaxID=588596 RepID=A0A915Z2V9_9GLOM|nr:unnamed protein product [Rhizophagus irregularis]
MDNYHDDNVYVYENEAENRMPSPDNNVENDFYEDEPEDSPLKEIYSGQTFTSFEILEQSLKRYASQKGFEIRVVRSEKEANVWARKTYKCHHGGKYIPKKKVDPTQTRNRESIRIECGFLVNASYRKCQNLVFVNKFVSEHNHELQNGIDLQEFSPLLRKIPDNIVEEIQFYVQECHLGATVLKRILRKKYPDHDIYNQDLYNMICRFKANIQIKNDAAALVEYLVKLHAENPEWYFKVDFENFEHRWTDLINHYPEVQEYCERVLYPTKTCWAYAFTKRSFSANTHSTQRVESMNRVIKLEANSGNSLCQLHSGIELRLKDEAKYARWQEFCNMNPTTGMPRVSDTIFRNVDEICKKYLTPNSLALQRKQMVESLLYRTWIKEVENIYLLDSNRYDEGFVEDDYEEPQILINMALEACLNGIVNEIWEFNIKLIPSRWYSKEGLSVMDKIQENSIQLIQDGEQRTGTFYTLNIIRGQEVYNEFIKNLDSKKEIFGREIGLCKKALNLAIASNSHQVFENLLQQFIEQQTVSLSAQDDDLTEEVLSISNPIQHKGKGRPANKRYLSAIENHSNRNANSRNQDQDEVSEGSRKKNKRQCALCKSWYHDSRNCPSKNKEQDKENI